MSAAPGNFDRQISPIESEEKERRRLINSNAIYSFPWWGLSLIVIGIWVAISIASDEIYSNIFGQLFEGIILTLRVSVISYVAAFLIGLLIGLIRSQKPRPGAGPLGVLIGLPRLLLYNAATFYVEVMRGLPMLIVLLIFAFVIIPAFRNWLGDTFGWQVMIRGSSEQSAIVALSLTYAAYMSEIFRAGIQSIERGQIEASRSLGMTYMQTMRYIVLPQAIRRVLPPLGNDFVAIIKDSSLVAILGIRDITQIAKVSSGQSFRYLETYMTVAAIYLTLTILGSMVVRLMEKYFQQDER